MSERTYCLGVIGTGRNATICPRATTCRRWTEFQQLRRHSVLKAESLVCTDDSWRGFVGVVG